MYILQPYKLQMNKRKKNHKEKQGNYQKNRTNLTLPKYTLTTRVINTTDVVNYNFPSLVKANVFSQCHEWLFRNGGGLQHIRSDSTFYLLPAPPLFPHGVTVETPQAHMLQIVIARTPPPQTPCLTIYVDYIFRADVCLLSMCGTCWASVHAHAHHLGHKVSSVHGTWGP